MSEPVVSVAICMHNGSRYIDEALQSVFAQTFQEFEIIVVDGSTDGSADGIERRFPEARMTLVRRQQQTLRVARSVAIAHAKGDFIAFIGHGDVWLPDKLERQVTVAGEATEAALIFSDCLLIDDSGRTVGRLSDQYDFDAIDLTGSRGHLELLRRGCFVPYPTAFVRASAVRAVGGFNDTYQYVSDYDLWLRLARRYSLKFIRAPLAKYRIHGTPLTQRRHEIALAEHRALLLPILRSSTYPQSVRIAVGNNLLGQHCVAWRLLFRQRRFTLAARAALGICLYPDRVRQSMRHRIHASAIGPPVESGLVACYRAKDAIARANAWARNRTALGIAHSVTLMRPIVLRVRRAPWRIIRALRGEARVVARLSVESAPPPSTVARPTEIWIDGSPLGSEQTGYFNLVAELIRRLAQHRAPTYAVHVVTQASGRVALVGRLGSDAAPLYFHSLGWRAVHWTDIHQALCGWHAQLLLALLSVGLLALGTTRGSAAAVAAAAVLLVGQCALLLDEVTAGLAEASRRPRERYSARLLRFFWRRMPAPHGHAPDGNTIEVLVWRGRFRWRDSRRIAVVQDMTTRIHPELHPSGNVAEFDEFLGYVQRHAHTIITVSQRSRQDIVDRIAVCPDSVSVIPMPVHPQYVQPHFSRGLVAALGITTPYVLSVGAVEPRKNLRRLVKAFELLKDEHAAKGHVLVLVGPQAWDTAFREFLIGTDAFPRVRMAGFVPLEHLPSLYHFASAVVCPSVYEGFGIPVMEAMCSSAIVLASRISSLPEVLGHDGMLFDPYDTEDVARVLLGALALSPGDATSYRRRCRQRAEAHLDRLAQEGPLPDLRIRSVVEAT